VEVTFVTEGVTVARKPPVIDPLPATRIITKPDQSAALQVRRARLKVIKGPDKGQQKDLPHPGAVVGSSPDCDLMLTDAAVSRRHFEILPGEDGFTLRDLGSKNGTLVGGMLLGQVTLTAGADIQVGQSRLRFSILDEHDEYPLSSKTAFGAMLGRSVAMRQVFALLEPAATSEVTLILEGESGTGKDLAAETIHSLSPRRGGPFVVVDCGAVHSTLAESELFGHKKGAFTGADSDRAGAIESADGGTVFLDEIGEVPPEVQPKLLRFLESKEVKRLGENRYRQVDVRLIAATNRDLTAEVEAGRFREDLYYRLSVVRVRFPPLRDRREDIGPLARSFVQKLRPDADPVEVISDQVLSMFHNHDWPGNVRELRNVVERLLLFPDRPRAALSPTGVSSGREAADLLGLPFHEARRAWTDRFEKVYLSSMLDAHGGVVSQAAEAAGIPRQTFHRLMTKHRLKK
jgi:two-component system response regulator GlrR